MLTKKRFSGQQYLNYIEYFLNYYDYEKGKSFFDTHVFAIMRGGILGKITFFSWIENNILDEIVSFCLIAGGLLIIFSKEKNEDEYISSLRLNALLWAVFTNHLILIISVLFVYDMIFLWILEFNMFTIIFIFLSRFYWLLHRVSKQTQQWKTT